MTIVQQQIGLFTALFDVSHVMLSVTVLIETGFGCVLFG